MSINIGLTSDENFNCVVGFSGKIIDKDNLAKRISSTTKMLLLHGDKDAVVPSSNLLDAKDFLLRNKIEVETNMISDCDHHIPIKASSIALSYLKKNFSI
jgi:phospholipase/carboxylesterase